jgi:hypothetical protein
MNKRLVPCFEVLPPTTIHKGIAVSKHNEIVLGEEGRGRILTCVPVPEGSIIKGGTAYAIPVSNPNAAAMITIRDFSGYRGGWELVQNLPADVLLEYGRTLDFELVTQVAEKTDPPLLIAYGRKAQGMAGRMGRGDELLFIARLGESYDIIRFGRLYGAPRVLRLNVLDGQVELIDLALWARRIDAVSRW